MFFENSIMKNKTLLRGIMNLKKIPRTSNASINIIKLKHTFNKKSKFKNLFLYKKWHSGRCNSGKITVYSKGPRLKKRLPVLNYKFRLSSLFFIASIDHFGFKNKLSSLLFNSCGQVTYVPTRYNDRLFFLNCLKPINASKSVFFKRLAYLNSNLTISNLPFILLQQKRNYDISFIELKPLLGSQYVRSLGCSAQIVKLDTRVGLSLLRLPSGVKKVFSSFSLSQEGPSNLSILKKSIKSNKSGDWRKKGLKSLVRGVAMNPVDHPHGGRTKSIKYPRTPWGKTTKYK